MQCVAETVISPASVMEGVDMYCPLFSCSGPAMHLASAVEAVLDEIGLTFGLSHVSLAFLSRLDKMDCSIKSKFKFALK